MSWKTHPLTPTASSVPALAAALPIGGGLLALAAGVAFVLAPATGWSIDADGPVVLDIDGLRRIFGDAIAYHLGPIDAARRIGAALSATDATAPLLGRLAACGLVTVVASRAVYRRVYGATPRAIAARHVAGREPRRGGAAIAHLRGIWRARNDGTGILIAPGLGMPLHVECEGIGLLGRPGSGKTVILEGLVRQALDRGDRVFLLDVKGDLPRRLGRFGPRVLSLRPGHGAVWAIGRDVRTRRDALELAAAFIPESRDPIWSAGSRLILAALILYLARRFGTDWGWRHLNHLLAQPVPTLQTIVRTKMPEVAALLESREQEPTAAALSLVMNLLAHTGALVGALAEAEARTQERVSIAGWIAGTDGAAPLVVQLDLRYREQAAVFAGMVVRQLGAEALGPALEDDVDHKLWIVLDELPRIGKGSAETVGELVALGRSRGIRTVVTYQAPVQLVQLLGEAGATALQENLGLKVVCRAAVGESARTIAAQVGKRTVSWLDYDEVETGQTRTEEIDVLTAEEISGGFGLRHDVLGRPLIRAAILGESDAAILDWPLRLWPRLDG